MLKIEYLKMLLLRNVVFTVAILVQSLTAFSQQQQKIDSILTLINNSKGIDKYDYFIEISRLYNNKNHYESLKWAQKGMNLAYEFGDTLRIVNANAIVGLILNRMGRFEEARTILETTLPVARRHDAQEDYRKILTNLAIAYTFLAKYDTALNLNFEVLKLYERDKDERNISMAFTNIGIVYYKLKDYRKSIEYSERALILNKRINELYFTDRLLINASLAYAALNEFSKAKVLADSALMTCGNECNNNMILESEYCFGVIHLGLEQFDKAKKHFIRSYNLAKTLKDDRFQFDNINFLVQICIQKNQYDKALEYLIEAEKLIADGEPLKVEIIKIYDKFLRVYAVKGDMKKLTYYQQKYIQVKESTFNETLTTNLMKVEAQFQERENKARIESQSKVLVLKEQVIESQQLVNILMGLVATILLGIAILLIRSIRQKQIMNKLLDKKVKERVRELELNRDGLLKANREMNILISQTSEDVKSYLLSINGLCEHGLAGIDDPVTTNYLSKVDATASNLASSLEMVNNNLKTSQ